MPSSRRWFHLLSLGAVLLAATAASTGPTPVELRIVGRVSHARTGAPLSAAQVFVREMNVGALTDASGAYAIVVPRDRLVPGDVHVVAQLIGFRRQETPLHVPDDLAGDSARIDFRLEEQVIGMEEVVVTGNARDAQRARPGASVSTDAPATGRSEAAVAAGEARAPRPAELPAVEMAVAGGWAPGATHPHGGRGWNREQYDHIAENGFRSVADHPLSTFAIDVDRASYSNVRRFLLREHRLPPVDAIQIEEMINYFSYHYALPEGDHPLAITTEVGNAPWAPDHRLVRVGLASRPVVMADLPPNNLVFLLDVSGSMATPDKLPLVKASMRMLVERLRPVDHVSIVVYAGAAGLVLEPTSGARQDLVLEAIERLEAGGSTAGGAGLRLAYRVARSCFDADGNNRVILATDGDFNVGESSDGAMIRLVEAKRKEGTFLTVLGFGTGNLQSAKMQGLAQHGNGNYAYIDGLAEAHKVLVSEMGGTLLTVAKDVKVQVEFNPARVRAYRLIGYENRLLAAEDFNDDAKDAGELGAGHTVTALYEVVPADVSFDLDRAGVDPLRYRASGRPSDPSAGAEIGFVKVRYKEPHGAESRLVTHPVRAGGERLSRDLSFAAAVAGFGMVLRGSEHRGSITAEQVTSLARDGIAADPDGHRRRFLELVEAYRELAGDDVSHRR
jgi:Ca-activated chloride channel family protein